MTPTAFAKNTCFLFIALILAACNDAGSPAPTADLVPAAPAVAAPTQPNILFILSDDQGVDASAEYPFSSDLPNTPTLSALATAGVVFENAWATPGCAPTRAAILTGKHGVHNGVNALPGNINEDEEILYEYLARDPNTQNYATAFFGKWHLGNEVIDGHSNPVANGIPYFAGIVQGNIPDFHAWDLTIDSLDGEPQTTLTTEYNTTALTRLAAEWIAAQTSPWMATLAYNAPHAPLHWPDESLHTKRGYTNADCVDAPQGTNSTRRDCFLAMTEAMDTEIGNLLSTFSEAQLANTLIIFMGDNGTSNAQRDTEVFKDGEAKFTLHEGGMRVPLFVSGAGVTRVNAREERLVNATDIYATIAELAGSQFDGRIQDGISFAKYLTSTDGDRRYHAYTDFRNAVFDGWTIRNHTHRLLRTHGVDTLYELSPHHFNVVDVTESAPDVLFELQIEGLAVRRELGAFTAMATGPARDPAYGARTATCARHVGNYGASSDTLTINLVEGVCEFVAGDTYRVTATPELAGAITYPLPGQKLGIYLNGTTIDIPAADCADCGHFPYDSSGEAESGTIGFAADGFPIYGSFIRDQGQVREVQSSYRGMEFVAGSGDLDECNGMVKDGSYGYYLTPNYPFTPSCFKGAGL